MEDWEKPFRDDLTCRGCGQPKNHGELVCWQCFKYREVCLKYFPWNWPAESAEQQFNNWLHAIGRDVPQPTT